MTTVEIDDVVAAQARIAGVVHRSARRAEAAIAEAQLAGPVADFDTIVIDLDDVDRVAMAGFRLLVKTAVELGEKGGKLAIVNADDDVRRFMWTTGLHEIVTVTGDETAAATFAPQSRIVPFASAAPAAA